MRLERERATGADLAAEPRAVAHAGRRRVRPRLRPRVPRGVPPPVLQAAVVRAQPPRAVLVLGPVAARALPVCLLCFFWFVGFVCGLGCACLRAARGALLNGSPPHPTHKNNCPTTHRPGSSRTRASATTAWAPRGRARGHTARGGTAGLWVVGFCFLGGWCLFCVSCVCGGLGLGGRKGFCGGAALLTHTHTHTHAQNKQKSVAHR